MPANVVKTKADEKEWKRAKRLAADQGHEGDYAYIMGIYKRLTKSRSEPLSKADGLWTHMDGIRLAQQSARNIRSPAHREVMGLAQPKTITWSPDHHFARPINTPKDIAKNLGLPPSAEQELTGWARDLMSIPNEVALRQALIQKTRAMGGDPELRREIAKRAITLYRSMRMNKSMARGGKYVRRVPKAGGGWIYYYDEDKYNQKNPTGKDAAKAYITKALDKIMRGNKRGVTLDTLAPLVKRYDRSTVAEVLKEQVQKGTLKLNKNLLMSATVNVQKSEVTLWLDPLHKARTVTPIGGITPGGYKKIAKDVYIKVDKQGNPVSDRDKELAAKYGDTKQLGLFDSPQPKSAEVYDDAPPAVLPPPPPPPKPEEAIKAIEVSAEIKAIMKGQEAALDKLAERGITVVPAKGVTDNKSALDEATQMYPMTMWALKKKGFTVQWSRGAQMVPEPPKLEPEPVPEDLTAKEAKKVVTEVKEARKRSKAKREKTVIEQTGDHIWGAARDKIAARKIATAEDLEGLTYEEVTAALQKELLITIPTVEQFKERGFEPHQASMLLSLVSKIKAKPGKSPGERVDYLECMRQVNQWLENPQALPDQWDLLREVKRTRETTLATNLDRAEVEAVAKEARKEDPKAKLLLRSAGIGGGYNLVRSTNSAWHALGVPFVAAVKHHHTDPRFATYKVETTEEKWGVIERGLADDGKTVKEKSNYSDRAKEALERIRGVVNKHVEIPEGLSDEEVQASLAGRLKPPDPQRIIDTYGLREIDYGTSVTQDERVWHTQALELSMGDLAAALEIGDPKQVSLFGKIGVAIGARGRGRAAAHYEPGTKAINLTRNSGAGSLAHEWLHALDNIVYETYEGATGLQGEPFLSASPGSLKNTPEPIKQALQKVMDAIKKPSPEYARKVDAWISQINTDLSKAISENNADIARVNKLQAMPKDRATLDRAIAKAKEGLKEYEARLVDGKKKGYRAADLNKIQSGAEYYRRRIAQLEDPRTEVLTETQRTELADLIKKHEDYHLPLINGLKREKAKLLKSRERSKFMGASISQGDYWARNWELMARSFEVYLSAKLQEKGIKNDYLVKDEGRLEMYGDLYPSGEEAQNINRAFDELMAAIKSEGTLQKAMLYLASLRKA